MDFSFDKRRMLISTENFDDSQKKRAKREEPIFVICLKDLKCGGIYDEELRNALYLKCGGMSRKKFSSSGM